MGEIAHLGPFPVIELRRYRIADGETERFAISFESFFPEAFQQLGAYAAGQFFERDDPARFTWLRCYRSLEERASVNTAFYDGPLWKEHAATANGRLVDSDDVLLLEPLSPERGIPILPAVDPVAEPDGARGVAIAHVFATVPGGRDALSREAETAFARYAAAGAREAGVLVTLDVENNFPRHPIRTDGPFLVWLGVLPDERALAALEKTAGAAGEALTRARLLRGAPELVVLRPARRSRLRWI